MTKPSKTKDERDRRIGELEDQLRERDRRIAELRAEIDEGRTLITSLREHVEAADGVMESWIESFDMQMNDNGRWGWKAWIEACEKDHENYVAIVRDYNKLVGRYNALLNDSGELRNVGRPLGADEEQRAEIVRLREEGRSLREIADDMELGVRTIRTVLGQYSQGSDRGKDRTSRKYAERIQFDRKAETTWKAQARTRKALPKRVGETLEEGRELVKQAKGLK